VNRTKALRLAVWSSGIAISVVGLWWLVWWVAGEQTRLLMNNMTMVLFEPALAVAVLLSPNPHDLNGFIWFISQAVQAFIVIYIVALAINLLRGSSSQKVD
jgi:hypothetical protein